MGFPVFPGVSAGVLPILIINVAMSIAAFKDAVRSVLQVVGLRRGTDSNVRETLSFHLPEDSSLGSSLVLPSMSDEIRVALPVLLYDPELDNALSLEDAQCAVCLSDLQKAEEIRKLPYCNHVFHKGCLDRWLDHQQTTCPLCRSSLVPEDIARKQRRREQELTEELIIWFSSFHGSGLQGLWWQN